MEKNATHCYDWTLIDEMNFLTSVQVYTEKDQLLRIKKQIKYTRKLAPFVNSMDKVKHYKLIRADSLIRILITLLNCV